MVETYPVTVALATVFADMTDSEKKGARQVHEVFRNNINRLGSELEDEEEGYVAGDKVEFYVQAIDRETGDDIDSEEAPELTENVETMKEDFGKEADQNCTLENGKLNLLKHQQSPYSALG